MAEFAERWRDRGLETIGLPDNYRSGQDIVALGNTMMAEAGSTKEPMSPARTERGAVTIVDWPKLEDEIAGLGRFMRNRVDSFLVLVPRRFIGHRLQRLIGADSRTAFYQEALERTLVQERFALGSLLPNSTDAVAIRAWLGFEGESFAQATDRNREACASFVYAGSDIGGLCQRLGSGETAVKGTGRLNVLRRAAHWTAMSAELPGTLRDRIAYLFNPQLADALETNDARAEARAALSDLRDAALALIEDGAADLAAIIDALRYRIATRMTLLDVPTEPRVRIMTLHSAKGLEADTVAVVGVADQIIPGIPDPDPAEAAEVREEQRRLVYVAISRARNALIVSWSRSALYVDARNNQVRIDATYTDAAGDRRVRLSRSGLLPGSLPAPTPGATWLRTFAL